MESLVVARVDPVAVKATDPLMAAKERAANNFIFQCIVIFIVAQEIAVK